MDKATFAINLNEGESEVFLCRAHLAYGITRYADMGDIIWITTILVNTERGCMGGALNWPEYIDIKGIHPEHPMAAHGHSRLSCGCKCPKTMGPICNGECHVRESYILDEMDRR